MAAAAGAGAPLTPAAGAGGGVSWAAVRDAMGQLEALCTAAGDRALLDTLQRTRLDLQDVFAASETNAKRALLGERGGPGDARLAPTGRRAKRPYNRHTSPP